MIKKIVLISLLSVSLLGCAKVKEEDKPENRPEPKFKNGDIVQHIMTEIKGHVINPTNGYSSQQGWSVEFIYYKDKLHQNDIDWAKSGGLKVYYNAGKVCIKDFVYESELKLVTRTNIERF